jgi:breast cancer 2 susceptibility protein
MKPLYSDITTLNKVTPDTAVSYVFHSRNEKLGPAEALNELHRQGCTLATKPWVINHWCLILWKLAGMVALDPRSEEIQEQKRWCWSEVIRQLLYR